MADNLQKLLGDFQQQITNVHADLVLDPLVECQVLCSRRAKRILNSQIPEEQINRLLYELKRSDHPNALWVFIDALQPSYPHLAHKLKNAALDLSDPQKPHEPQPSNSSSSFRSSNPTSVTSQQPAAPSISKVPEPQCMESASSPRPPTTTSESNQQRAAILRPRPPGLQRSYAIERASNPITQNDLDQDRKEGCGGCVDGNGNETQPSPPEEDLNVKDNNNSSVNTSGDAHCSLTAVVSSSSSSSSSFSSSSSSRPPNLTVTPPSFHSPVVTTPIQIMDMSTPADVSRYSFPLDQPFCACSSGFAAASSSSGSQSPSIRFPPQYDTMFHGPTFPSSEGFTNNPNPNPNPNPESESAYLPRSHSPLSHMTLNHQCPFVVPLQQFPCTPSRSDILTNCRRHYPNNIPCTTNTRSSQAPDIGQRSCCHHHNCDSGFSSTSHTHNRPTSQNPASHYPNVGPSARGSSEEDNTKVGPELHVSDRLSSIHGLQITMTANVTISPSAEKTELMNTPDAPFTINTRSSADNYNGQNPTLNRQGINNGQGTNHPPHAGINVNTNGRNMNPDGHVMNSSEGKSNYGYNINDRGQEMSEQNRNRNVPSMNLNSGFNANLAEQGRHFSNPPSDSSSFKQTPCENIDLLLRYQDSMETDLQKPLVDSEPHAIGTQPPIPQDNQTSMDGSFHKLNLDSNESGHETERQKLMWESLSGPEAIHVTESNDTASIGLEGKNSLQRAAPSSRDSWDTSTPGVTDTSTPGVTDTSTPGVTDAVTSGAGGANAAAAAAANPSKEPPKENGMPSRDRRSWKRGAIRKKRNQSKTPSTESTPSTASSSGAQCFQYPLDASLLPPDRVEYVTLLTSGDDPETLQDRPQESRVFEVILERRSMAQKFGLKFVHGSISDQKRWKDDDDEYFVTYLMPFMLAAKDGRIEEGDTIESVNGQTVRDLEESEIQHIMGQGRTVRLRLRRYKKQ